MDSYETSIYTAVLITAVVLWSSIAYFAVSVFRQHKNSLKMQRLVFSDEINLLEKERRRISNDLHDDIGPLLSTIKTYLEQMHPVTEKEAGHLDKAEELLSRLMKRMGQIAINLTPKPLIKKGLAFTLDQFFKDLSEVYPIRFLFRYEVDGVIEADKSIHLYRIVQEVSHNVLKHANASELHIHFKQRKDIVYLYCKDDGVGFSIEEMNEKRPGLGLSSLQSRTALLDGKMQMHSAPGKGTEYFFEFPLFKIP